MPRARRPFSVQSVDALACMAIATLAETALREAETAAGFIARTEGASSVTTAARAEADGAARAAMLAREAATLEERERHLAYARAHRDAALRLMQAALQRHRKPP